MTQLKDTIDPTIPDATFDLTSKLAPFLDLHLMLPMLQHLINKKIYDKKELLHAKLELLKPTCMIDFAIELYQTANDTKEIPSEIEGRRKIILNKLETCKKDCLPLLNLFENEDQMNILRDENQLTLPHLEEKHGINASMLESYDKYTKLQYECGNYERTFVYLTYYSHVIPSDSDEQYRLLWGKLACCILRHEWIDALNFTFQLNDLIEAKKVSYLEQSNQRTWLLHWSLFVFAWHDTEGRNAIIDMMFSSRYIEAILKNAPWLLRYLVCGIFAHTKRKYNLLEECIKILQIDGRMESFRDQDPMIDFICSNFIEYKFEDTEEMKKTFIYLEKVLTTDFFLCDTMQLEIIESARQMVFNQYCKTNGRILINNVALKLAFKGDDKEKRIYLLKLLENSKLNAKIDLEKNLLLIDYNSSHPCRTVLEKTKELATRVFSLATYYDKTIKPNVPVSASTT